MACDLVSHVWLKGEACRRGERCRVSLHKALPVITGVQPLHSPLQNIQALVPRGFQAVFCWQVGAQCPAQASMVAEVTTLLKHKHTHSILMEKRTWIVWICVNLSVKHDYDGWTIALKHLSRNYPPGLVFSGLIWRVFHPGFYSLSLPTPTQSLSPSFTHPRTQILLLSLSLCEQVWPLWRSKRRSTPIGQILLTTISLLQTLMSKTTDTANPVWEMALLFTTEKSPGLTGH